jgi:hypothetical protein
VRRLRSSSRNRPDLPAGEVTGRGGPAFSPKKGGLRPAAGPAGRFLAPGLILLRSCAHCGANEAGGRVYSRTVPGHARRLGATRWAERRWLRPRAGREPAQPAARYDPLAHPVAITGHAVIGDQIRVPCAGCEMVGCEMAGGASAFADPAALREAGNRAATLAAGRVRTLSAGWFAQPASGVTGWHRRGRCACGSGDAAGGNRMADVAPAAEGRVGRSLRSVVSGCHRAVSLLAALAGDSNGWTALQPGAAPDAGREPAEAGGPAVFGSAAHHAATVGPGAGGVAACAVAGGQRRRTGLGHESRARPDQAAPAGTGYVL